MLVIGLEAEIQWCGTMASEFRDGKTDSWDVPKYVTDLEELERMRTEEMARAEGLASSFGVMTTNDPVLDDWLKYVVCAIPTVAQVYAYIAK